jgi:hypothetical protein
LPDDEFRGLKTALSRVVRDALAGKRREQPGS